MNDTNLLLQASPLSPTFVGTPQQLFEEMIRRIKIVSPTGISFIHISDTEPTSNVGPWLKDGNQWYIFSDDLKRYVPILIDDSETNWYKTGNSTPTDSTPPLWLRTTRDATEENPSYGTAIGWLYFNGTNWVDFDSLVFAGPTASRPTSPAALQRFYDTDISVLIWFERGSWRTVAGVPGDVKSVVWDTLGEALEHNPGWELLGASNQSFRGRIITQAAADFDGSDAVTVDAGLATRNAAEIFGESDGVSLDSSSSVPYPPQIALWHLVKL
jgi:hypothetical protein